MAKNDAAYSGISATIPTEVRIGARVFRVMRVGREVMVADHVQDTGEEPEPGTVCYGTIRFDTLEIHLLDTIGEAELWMTLLHEVIHGVAVDRMVDLDERDVVQLTHGLSALLVDNGIMRGVGAP